MSIKVIILEDNIPSAELVIDVCKSLGWDTAWTTTNDEALDLLLKQSFNIIVLDRILNDGMSDGLQLLERLGEHGISMAVLVLSSLGSLKHRVEGLDSGADVYLTKPFDSKELRAQLVSLARRLGFMGGYSTVTQVGKLEIRDNVRHASWDGKTLELTDQTYRLLKCLVRHPGEVVDRDFLWRYAWPAYERLPRQDIVLEQAMTRLRRELKKYGGAEFIRTARRRGYFVENA